MMVFVLAIGVWWGGGCDGEVTCACVQDEQTDEQKAAAMTTM